jgi:hypothetical protein
MGADDVERCLAGVVRELEILAREVRLLSSRQAAIDERMREIVEELRARTAYVDTVRPSEKDDPA